MSQAADRLVMIVDDDESVRTVLARAVELAGYVPIEAVNGTDGFARLEELADRVALVILDLTMAGLDGFGFRRLQLDNPRVAAIPTIVLTGQELDLQELLALGLHTWLQKPLSVDHVVRFVQQYARDLL